MRAAGWRSSLFQEVCGSHPGPPDRLVPYIVANRDRRNSHLRQSCRNASRPQVVSATSSASAFSPSERYGRLSRPAGLRPRSAEFHMTHRTRNAQGRLPHRHPAGASALFAGTNLLHSAARRVARDLTVQPTGHDFLHLFRPLRPILHGQFLRAEGRAFDGE
jgi:hypothetical protein